MSKPRPHWNQGRRRHKDKFRDKKLRKLLSSPCGRPPVAPTGLTSSYDRNNANRQARIRMTTRWNEVSTDTSGFVITIKHYVLEFEYSANDVDWFVKTRRVVSAKKDDDPGTKDHFTEQRFHKRLAYRWRVRAVSTDDCSSAWSDYKNMGTPGPEEPPAPCPVEIFHKAADRVVLDWDEPTDTDDDDVLDDKVAHFQAQISRDPRFRRRAFTVALATDALTDTAHGLNNGDQVRLEKLTGGAGLTGPRKWYYVVSATANTFKLSLTEGGTAVNVTTDGSGFWTTIYRFDKFVAASRKSFHIPQKHRDDTFYGRVRSMSVDRDTSAWIPATRNEGNCDPAAAPSGVRVAPVRHVARFTIPGDAIAKTYPQLFTADQDYKFKKAKVRAGKHEAATHPDTDGCPTGAALKLQVIWRNEEESSSQDLFASTNVLKVDAGTHQDTAFIKTFSRTRINEGEHLAIQVAQIGSVNPGSDVVVTLVLEPLDEP